MFGRDDFVLYVIIVITSNGAGWVLNSHGNVPAGVAPTVTESLVAEEKFTCSNDDTVW